MKAFSTQFYINIRNVYYLDQRFLPWRSFKRIISYRVFVTLDWQLKNLLQPTLLIIFLRIVQEEKVLKSFWSLSGGFRNLSNEINSVCVAHLLHNTQFCSGPEAQMQNKCRLATSVSQSLNNVEISTIPRNLTLAYLGEKNKNSFHLLSHWHSCYPTVPSVPHISLQIVLPPHLDNVRDKLAENIHELWGMNKIELGWTYGKVKLLSIMLSTHRNTLGVFGNGEWQRSTWALSSKMHYNGLLTLISQSSEVHDSSVVWLLLTFTNIGLLLHTAAEKQTTLCAGEYRRIKPFSKRVNKNWHQLKYSVNYSL